MAKAGAGSAYSGLRVPDGGISQSLQYWGGLLNRDNRQDKLAEERADVRRQQEIKDWEAQYGLKAEDFQSKYTGFKTRDDMMTDFSMYMADEYVKMQRQAREALDSGDLQTRKRLEGEMIKMKGAFNEVKKGEDHFAKVFEEYQKAAGEGRVSGASKGFEEVMQEVIQNSNAVIRRDDSGNLVYNVVVNGPDGKQRVEQIPYQDLMDGSFRHIEKQQLNGKGGLVDNVLTTLGEITKQDAQGYYMISEKAWDPKIHGDAAEKAIDALMNDNDVMADLLHQTNKTVKRKDFNDADRKAVKENLMSRIKAGYDEEYNKKFMSGKYSADSSAAARRASGKNNQPVVVEAEPVTSAGGVMQDGAYTLRSTDGEPIQGIFETNPDADILSVQLTPTGIRAQRREEVITDPIFDTKEFRTSEVELTQPEMNRLARAMQYPTAVEMVRALQQRAEEFRNRTGAQGPVQPMNDPLNLGI